MRSATGGTGATGGELAAALSVGDSARMGDSDTRRVDSRQLVRQWALLRLLVDSRRGFTVKELSEQLGASKTTIQRDLATLQSEFALISEEQGAQKKLYRIDQSIRALETLHFGCLELLAVQAAVSMTSSLAGTPIAEDLKSVAMKIRGFLSPRHNGGLNAMARVFLPHARSSVDYATHSAAIGDLTDAIARRHWCTASYYSPWKDTTRTHRFRPLRLIWHRASLYLLCIVDGKSEITTMAVHRVRSLEVTSDEFAPPRADVPGHVRKAFGIFVSEEEETVEVIFDQEVAWLIEERTFHPDEIKERLDDGRLRYTIQSSAQWEVIPWVLSYGGHAELVAPEAWRAAARDSLQAALARYESGEAGASG